MHLLDFASMKKLPLAKPVIALLGSGFVCYSVVMVAVTGERMAIAAWLSPLGWTLLAISVYLMMYSLYAALPFSKTYVKTGLSSQLVTGGLYSIVRHPWLLFFALAMIGLTMGSRSILAMEAGIVWTTLSSGLVYFQDRWVFPMMFHGYAEYQKTTPMLMPTKSSLSAFFKGLKNQNKVSEEQSK